MASDLVEIDLLFGNSGSITFEVLKRQLVSHHPSTQQRYDISELILDAFHNPVDYPPVHQAFVPSDQIVIVIEHDTPQPAALLAALWNELETAEVLPENVLVLLPALTRPAPELNLLSYLDPRVAEKIIVLQHDPTDESCCTYLANTAAGDRIELAQELIDADAVITIGPAGFDAVLGYRGDVSSIYPGLSTVDAIRKAMGQGHDELSPDDSRPLRQVVDEIGWLLGSQLTISVIPGGGGTIENLYVGQRDAVLRKAKDVLKKRWAITDAERAEAVVVTTRGGATPESWEQTVQAIETARRLVARDGRIIVLTELNEPLPEGLKVFRAARNASEALPSIREKFPADLPVATHLARAVEWANVYLLSQHDDDLVENLFIIPLNNVEEVQRLLVSDDTMTIIADADLVFGQC